MAVNIRASQADKREELTQKIRSLLSDYTMKGNMAKEEDEIEFAKSAMTHMPQHVKERITSINKAREELNRQRSVQMKAFIDKEIKPYQDSIVREIERLGGEVTAHIYTRNSLAARIPASAVSELARHPQIVEISLDLPGKPDLDNQVVSLGANSFWYAGDNGGVWDVGILDTGVEETHDALRSHQFYENYTANGSHGTGVACIYASTNSTYKGLAFGLDSIFVDDATTLAQSQQGADWMLVSVSLPEHPVTINYSVSNGSANGVSWGNMAKFVDAVVYNYDVFWAKSAGNTGYGTTSITQPGENYNGMTVADMDDNNTVSRTDDLIDPTSARGPTADNRKKPDITAPGRSTYTCTTGNSWDELGGTSAATPKVGAASLLLRDAGHDHAMTIKAVLINTADAWEDNDTEMWDDDGQVSGSEWNKTYGWGYMNLLHAEAHKNDYFYTYLTPRGTATDYRLFKGQGYIGDKATMVWERDVKYKYSDYGFATTPTTYRALSNLDLNLYNETSNNLEDYDIDYNDNVHQVSPTTSGPKVIKAYAWSTSFDGVSSEYFALATEENFSAATGPKFAISSSAPSPVGNNQIFTVTATVKNAGDLKAHNTNITLKLPSSFTLVSGPAIQWLGGIEKGATASASWQVKAPYLYFSTSYALSFTGDSNSYGEIFSSTMTKNITVKGLFR